MVVFPETFHCRSAGGGEGGRMLGLALIVARSSNCIICLRQQFVIVSCALQVVQVMGWAPLRKQRKGSVAPYAYNMALRVLQNPLNYMSECEGQAAPQNVNTITEWEIMRWEPPTMIGQARCKAPQVFTSVFLSLFR